MRRALIPCYDTKATVLRLHTFCKWQTGGAGHEAEMLHAHVWACMQVASWYCMSACTHFLKLLILIPRQEAAATGLEKAQVAKREKEREAAEAKRLEEGQRYREEEMQAAKKYLRKRLAVEGEEVSPGSDEVVGQRCWRSG